MSDLEEGIVAQIRDRYEDALEEKETVALLLTDDIIGLPGQLGDAQVAVLKEHYSDAEIAELALGVGLFLGMSKVLIALGLEPRML